MTYFLRDEERAQALLARAEALIEGRERRTKARRGTVKQIADKTVDDQQVELLVEALKRRLATRDETGGEW